MANRFAPEPQSPKPSKLFTKSVNGQTSHFDMARLETLDNTAASSLMQFILLQRAIPDYSVNAIFLALPLTNPLLPSLKKAILLRSLASKLCLCSVSEETLTVIELIEELDRENGCPPPSEAMRAAYCGIASFCTSSALLQSKDDFLDSYNRIWRRRISDMEKSPAAGLVSEELLEMRSVFEEMISHSNYHSSALNTDLEEEALGHVRDYLEEVWDLDPLFPNASPDHKHGADLRVPTEPRDLADEVLGSEPTDLERLLMEIDADDEQSLKSSCLDLQGMVQRNPVDATKEPIELASVHPKKAHSNELIGNGNQDMLVERACTSKIGSNGTNIEGKETNTMLNLDSSCLKEMDKNENGQDVCAAVASLEKVPVIALDVDDEQSLKSSYLDLQGMVQMIPLDATNQPFELHVNNNQNMLVEQASTSKIGSNVTNIKGNETSTKLNKFLDSSCLKEMDGNENGQVVCAAVASLEKVPDIALGKESCSMHNIGVSGSLPRASLMERNATAQTLEWADSPPMEALRFHLHSPKREAVSPLKLIDDKRCTRRRKIRKWALLEEETLLKGVRELGKGSWKAILSKYSGVFEERTEVDLKDKWRSMTRSK